MSLVAPEPSPLLLYGFLGLVVGTVALALVGVRRAVTEEGALAARRSGVGLGIWMVVTGGQAWRGALADFEAVPPALMVIVFVGAVCTIILAVGRTGKQVAAGSSVAGLIGFQAFRLPLELIMHRATTEGIMPVQMSFEGRNLDIVTGILATCIGGVFMARKRPVPPAIAWGFNILGFALLLNIVVVSVASVPTFAAFGPEQLNTWVAFFPFVWLPAVFVMLALFGHIVLTRRLLEQGRSASS